MNTTTPVRVFIDITRFLLIVLFVYTATTKLANNHFFYGSLLQSILTKPYASWLRWFIPVIELAIAALLVVRRTIGWGLLAAISLITVFTIYIGYMLVFIPELPCSCGGVISKMTWQQHLLFNVFFSCLGCLAGIFYYRQKPIAIQTGSFVHK